MFVGFAQKENRKKEKEEEKEPKSDGFFLIFVAYHQ